MTTAHRIAARQRLEDLRSDAIDLRNDTPSGSHTYGCLLKVIAELDSAIDGLKY